jgi:hypothetical protein
MLLTWHDVPEQSTRTQKSSGEKIVFFEQQSQEPQFFSPVLIGVSHACEL